MSEIGVPKSACAESINLYNEWNTVPLPYSTMTSFIYGLLQTLVIASAENTYMITDTQFKQLA